MMKVVPEELREKLENFKPQGGEEGKRERGEEGLREEPARTSRRGSADREGFCDDEDETDAGGRIGENHKHS
eukprot:752844-Hanusia_phi.AAC.4